MAGYKHNQLKNKSFDDIQKLFDKAMKRVNTFVDMDTELVEEDKESDELKQCLEIIPDDGDDVTIDATPLSTKSPTIVDYKIYKEGKKSYFQIIRANVKARFKKTESVNYMDNFLILNLKTMFEHHVEDNVWKNQQGLVKVLNWKIYDSCGVHCVTMQNILFYLLVEKMYPLTNYTLHQMFNDVKLQVDYECEMAFELLILVKKQLKEGYGRIVRIKSLLEVTAAKVYVIAAKKKMDKDIRKDKDSLEIKKLQDECDVQATNIVLQGLPPDVYSLVNHCQAAKDIWDRVKLLMQGTELSYQERECKLYNEFDKFTYVKEWRKFVTDVKLAKNMYNTNFDKLYAYLSQHERHANEARMLRERYPDPLALVANHQTQSHSAQYPQQLSSSIQQVHSSQPYLPTYKAPHHPQ
ncbi:hypothetical protein Tco_0780532 [Tanacetum coccineum]